MDNTAFQNLIGKHISVVKHVLADDLRNDFIGMNFYSSSSAIATNFYGIHYTNLIIRTDKDNMIAEITIYLDKVIDKSFYDLFRIDYGEPSTIQVVYEKKIISEGKSIDNSTDDLPFVQDLRQSIFKTREGQFNENPLYIIWNKKGYKIKALTRENQNSTDIIFRVPIKDF